MKASGNLPDDWHLTPWYDDSYLKLEWEEWNDNDECEFYLTALQPIDHELLIIMLYEEGDEDASAGTAIKISASK